MRPVFTLFKSRRFWGLTGLSLLTYVVLIGIFGNSDISRFLPPSLRNEVRSRWPDLPFFSVRREPADNGRDEETVFTVPTRQLSPQEIAALEATNQAAHPAAPR